MTRLAPRSTDSQDHSLNPSGGLSNPPSLKDASFKPIWPGATDSRPAPLDTLPIDRSQQEFRLWKFESRASPENLVLNLRKFSMQNCPPYVALSYEWRPPDSSTNDRDDSYDTISVNGGTLAITPNLRAFLGVLAASDYSDLWFWADQISVNQSNLEERGHQVKVMGNIYSQAQYVFSWLGTHLDDLETLQLSAGIGASVHGLDVEDLAELGVRLSKLSDGTYWSRLWIVQEVRSARQAILWCGQYSYPLEPLCRLMKQTGEALNKSAEAQKILDEKARQLKGHKAYYHWDYWLQGGTRRVTGLLPSPEQDLWDLESALRFVLWHRCTDHRDRIYGIQALVKHNQRIEIDYAKPVTELSNDVLEVVLDHGPSPEMSEHTSCWSWNNIEVADVPKANFMGLLPTLIDNVRRYYPYKHAGVAHGREYRAATTWSFWVRQIIRDYSNNPEQDTKLNWAREWRRIKKLAATPKQTMFGDAMELRKSGFEGSMPDLIRNTASTLGFTVGRFFVYHPEDELPPNTLWPLNWYVDRPMTRRGQQAVIE